MSEGGERERLAPVIPLFGGPVPTRPERPSAAARSSATGSDQESSASALTPAVPSSAATGPDSGITVEGSSPRTAEDEIAPPDVGGAWHPTWSADRPPLDDGLDPERTAAIELAEKALLKKLRTRSLSVSEARGALREHDLDAAATDRIIEAMDEYGYLDDAALADQLIHAGVDRKGQGRQVLAQTLAKRGIPRDVADAALAALPDDDFERALEFARAKARSLRSLERETALRRLTGQLARRGYGGSVAMTAARTALDESPQGSGGVRFV